MPVSMRKKRQRFSTLTSVNAADSEVYLCGECGKNFDSLQDLIIHEEGCGKDEEVVCLGAEITPQEALLRSNFKLCSKGGNPPSTRKLKEDEVPKASSYEKFSDIELSSPLGRQIVTTSKLGLDALKPANKGIKSAEDYIKEVEKNCRTTSSPAINMKKRWLNTFNLNNSKKKSSSWIHLYCFNDAEKKKRMKELHHGFPAEVMRLLRKCKRRKANLTDVEPQSGVEDVLVGGSNLEDDAIVDQQSSDVFLYEEEEMMAGIFFVEKIGAFYFS